MENETQKQPQNAIKNMACNLMLAVVIFFVLYAMASFTAWEWDCRKWDLLGRYCVILLTVVLSVILAVVRGRK